MGASTNLRRRSWPSDGDDAVCAPWGIFAFGRDSHARSSLALNLLDRLSVPADDVSNKIVSHRDDDSAEGGYWVVLRHSGLEMREISDEKTHQMQLTGR